MKIRGKRMAALAAAAVLLLSSVGARADDAAARFYGGARDGYDQATANQSGVDLPAFRALLAARNYGGVGDGYAVFEAEGVQQQRPHGTLILFR